MKQALGIAAAVLAVAACVPELSRVLPDRGLGGTDDHPFWTGSDLPTQIGIGDQSPGSDGLITHGKPELGPSDLRPPDLRPPDLRPPDQNLGKWYQADQKNCPSHCQSLGKANLPGPEGAHCMSGEVRSGSGIAQGIKFTWGCFGGCSAFGLHQAVSSGGECYMPGQKHDGDDTDRTVGCYCK